VSAETELHAALTGYAALTTAVADRIYPDFLAQEIPLPAVVYQRADTEYETTIHSGAVLASIVTFEIYCMATSRVAAEALANLVELAIAAPQNSLLPINRRPEFEPETLTFSTVVSCTIWPQ
jgi:hypothetical protein